MKGVANFFKGAALGMAMVSSPSPKLPNMSKYNQIEFLAEEGSGGFVVDNIYGINEESTMALLYGLMPPSLRFVWEPQTYLMAGFDNENLNGGNIPGIASEIIQWIVYRYDTKTGMLTPISKVNADQSGWIDYAATKGETYEYWIFALSADGTMSAAITTNRVKHDYFGWFLIDPENNVSYAFNLNQAGGQVTQGEEFVEHGTNSKYHVFSRGKTNYLEGTVSAIVADDCTADTQSLSLVESIREFILSDRPKIIKGNKGRVFKAFVSGYQDSDVAPYSDGDFKVINFSFKESGEA